MSDDAPLACAGDPHQASAVPMPPDLGEHWRLECTIQYVCVCVTPTPRSVRLTGMRNPYLHIYLYTCKPSMSSRLHRRSSVTLSVASAAKPILLISTSLA